MSALNSPTIASAGKNLSDKRSSPGITSLSSPLPLSKSNFKKPSHEAEGKDCVNISKIPRPPMPASYSFNETLKSNQSNGKTKKAPSMIPRSKSRKRNESGKIRIDIPSKVEYPKKYFEKPSGNKDSGEISSEYEIEMFLPPDDNSKKQRFSGEHENKVPKEELEISSLNVKSCRDDSKNKTEEPNVPYGEAQNVLSGSRVARREEEIKGPPAEEKLRADGNLPEEERETRTIKHLYDTIKCTVGSLFENPNWINPEKFDSREPDIAYSESTLSETVDRLESVSESSSIQDHYNFTLKEILNIWKSTNSLLGSVKNHAVNFVEENDKLIDKEQLSLEAEMLQAALDFAISYSKLKTEFLVTLVKERLNPTDAGVAKLENLMDSKIFATLYNVEDLAAMAKNVHDLSVSLLKGDSFELD